MSGHRPFGILAGIEAGTQACEIDLERWPCVFVQRGEQIARLTAERDALKTSADSIHLEMSRRSEGWERHRVALTLERDAALARAERAERALEDREDVDDSTRALARGWGEMLLRAERLATERDALRAALGRYGRHVNECEVAADACICGLRAALAAADAQKG